MFGCYEQSYNRISIGPGTSIKVCRIHYIEFQKALAPEDPNQYEKDMTWLNRRKLLNVLH